MEKWISQQRNYADGPVDPDGKRERVQEKRNSGKFKKPKNPRTGERKKFLGFPPDSLVPSKKEQEEDPGPERTLKVPVPCLTNTNRPAFHGSLYGVVS